MLLVEINVYKQYQVHHTSLFIVESSNVILRNYLDRTVGAPTCVRLNSYILMRTTKLINIYEQKF